MTSTSKIRRAFLFNFEKFDDSRMDRKNTSVDIKDFQAVIPKKNAKSLINFTSYANDKLDKKGLENILNNIAKRNHERDSYLLFIFSSHGDGNGILTIDMQMFPIEDILKKFSNCPVPTIFIFQACRGRSTDNGVETYFPVNDANPLFGDQLQQPNPVSSDSWFDSRALHNFKNWFTQTAKPLEASVSVKSSLKTIAKEMPSNSVIAFSTSPGRFSWRAHGAGGIFLQELTAAISHFQKNNLPVDIIKVLKFTNLRVGSQTYNYLEKDSRQERTPHEWVKLKQIGEVLSTLTEPLLLF